MANSKGLTIGLASLIAIVLCNQTLADIIPAGQDCWNTTCGKSRYDFCESPIPANFFGATSLSFDDTVFFQSNPSVNPSTIMVRPQPATVNLGTCDTVPIELLQLSLVSCSPIVVQNSGGGTSQWHVKVEHSDAPTGSITICKSHATGGTFTSTFFVQPVFTFTNVGNPGDVRVFDTGVAGFPPTSFESTAPGNWVQTAPGQCGAGFAPGIDGNPGPGCTTEAQCCTPVGHAGPGHLHETDPPTCVPCECGACCKPPVACQTSSTCTVTVQQGGGGSSAEQVCTNMGGTYMGAGTDCTDTDGDGLADVIESNGCCGTARDGCHTGTSPTDSDSDDDGSPDGEEVYEGTDPCVPGDPEICLPTMSTWSLIVLTLVMTVAGGILFHKRRRVDYSLES